MPQQTIDLDAFYRKQAGSRPRYPGQLAPEFQQALADRFQTIPEQDCKFYHTTVLPDGRIMAGDWDLRGHEGAYTGGLSYAGRRLIEFGPASGYFSAYFDRCGADVTTFDLPFGWAPELVPYSGFDLPATEESGADSVARMRNSWWYAKRAIGFHANAVYGDIYALPNDLGRFDVAFFGAILLHLSNPFLALRNAAAITTEAIIVTDTFGGNGDLPIAEDVQHNVPVMLFNPSPPPIGLVHWWSLSPGAIEQMLKVLGFTDTRVTTHVAENMQPPRRLFTVVGQRPGASRSRLASANSKEGGFSAAATSSEHRDLPLPPPRLRHLVAGTEDLDVFLQLGRRGFDALMNSLHTAGVTPSDLGPVLDFGCGVGRVLRYWRNVPGVEVHGTDVNPEGIGWAKENLRFAQVSTNRLEGPLEYPDGAFGLIYALSVFTHLPERMQYYWFFELLRVLRPGGFLYFTTHGAWYRRHLTPAQQADFDRGHPVVIDEARAGSNFCAAYHPEAAMRGLIAGIRGTRLAEFKQQGAAGNPQQDSWLVQKQPPGMR